MNTQTIETLIDTLSRNANHGAKQDDVARCNGGGIKGNDTCAQCKRSYAFCGAYGAWIDPAINGDECPNFLRA